MANWRRTVKAIISSNLTIVLYNEPLSKHTTFKIGGNSECFILINSKNDLRQILKFASREKIPYYIIGQGSNILISQQGIKGITIKLGKNFDKIVWVQSNAQFPTPNSYLSVGAATPLSKILRFCVAHSLSGLEFVWGIPGSLGGAISCNAGAFSQNIGDLIEQIYGISAIGEDVIITQKQLNFSYRKSNLPDNFIITDSVLKLKSCEVSNIKHKINAYHIKRKANQPTGASAGSVFKNPSTIPAGKLIDDCDLKGLRIGGAIISKKHGNFIINQSNAIFNDIYELMQLVKTKVELKTGNILEPEIKIFPKK